ncbi:hypothetical protein Q0F99_18160 [Rathayibacter oskolensis]|uniref:hypothetical protein n=1 Tax=Rathayibacter oskolensis TaxID=1891671 RepID=UPI00265E967A|nr:hypothetical protein [Rathayibacter oskolensis]WKK71338.1 hypothetical protein Q0F99_18160 [Rathayibacter oskolensis]
MTAVRLVAIGDSFTEGVGDELPDGSARGWADIAAQGLGGCDGRAHPLREPRDPRAPHRPHRRRAARSPPWR